MIKGSEKAFFQRRDTNAAPMEKCEVSSKKLKIELPYDPAILLLGIYQRKQNHYPKEISSVFTTALFIIGKTLKQPKCPSTDEWMKKMQHTHNGTQLSSTQPYKERNPTIVTIQMAGGKYAK